MSTKDKSFVAVDLGAGSGRLVLGSFDGKRVGIETVHRFESQPLRLPDGLVTDVAHIWQEIRSGLGVVAGRCSELAGIGVDSWGVDFALLDPDGGLLALPFHYRDGLGSGMDERTFAVVPRERLYAQTGNQSMPFNTLYQLLGLAERRPALLAAARQLLFIPDLFTHWLGGQASVERTIASTSQCFDPQSRAWSWQTISELGLPTKLFGSLIDPGTKVGTLAADLAQEVGLQACDVLAPAGHDTALAVAAVPAAGEDFAYISSGTWSLVGVEAQHPHLDAAACGAEYTNELGVCGTVRFLKIVCGLWLVQECQRRWAEQGQRYSFAELTGLAEQATPWQLVLDVDDPEFVPPGDMPARIAAYCERTGQQVVQEPGAMIRAILESIALKYRLVLSQLEQLTGRRLARVHIVGGGTQNSLLCQLSADATRRTTLAGPVEATAVGNVLMQAMASKELGSLSELREVVRRSFVPVEYEPQPCPGLDDAAGRLAELCAPSR